MDGGTQRGSGFTSYDALHLVVGFATQRIAGATGLLSGLAGSLADVMPGPGTAYAALISMLVFFTAGVVISYFWLLPPLKGIKSKWLRRTAVTGLFLLLALILAVTSERPG